MKTVQIYNLETKQLSTIPEAELAPGMVKANVVGVGIVWIDAKQAEPQTTFQHPPFDGESRRLIRDKIMRPLSEVCPKTLKQWEDGFRRDENPETEISLWVRIADRFARFCRAKPLFNAEQRKEAFEIMLHCTLVGSPEQVLETVQLEALSRNEAQEAIEAFCKAL